VAAAEHPVAIIEQATLPAQRVLRSTLAAVSARAAERQIRPPALLITGNVAAFAAADALGALGAASAPADAVA
jgi:siroheme synthase